MAEKFLDASRLGLKQLTSAGPLHFECEYSAIKTSLARSLLPEASGSRAATLESLLQRVFGLTMADSTLAFRVLVLRASIQTRLGAAHATDAFDSWSDAMARMEHLPPDAKHAKHMVQFALFCNERLADASAGSRTAPATFATSAVSCLLRAMAMGSPAARDRFPRVLHLVRNYPALRGLFTEHIRRIPAWMCLRWISQLLGELNSANRELVLPILEDISAEYPQALYYPMMASGNGLDLTKAREKHIVDQLQTNWPVLALFIAALDLLTHPDDRLKGQLQAVESFLKSDQLRAAEKAYDNMLSNCLDPALPGVGKYNAKFAGDWTKQVKEKLAKSGADLLQKKKSAADVAAFRASIGDSLKSARAKAGVLGGKTNLSNFSTWLADFNPATLGAHIEQHLEVPGQYSGLEKPDPTRHVRITSFGNEILVMRSLKVPKRLTIYGNDEREHKFLVKGYEDLRKDQRIEQLFSVMRTIMQREPACAANGLSIVTYEVIPMSVTVGVMQWVDDTKPLLDVLGCDAAYSSTIKALGAFQGDKWTETVKKPRDDVVKAFEEFQSKMPNTLLTTAFHKLVSSWDDYFAFRRRFCASISSLTICGYILGLGDRHLANILMRTTNGEAVGIDFDLCFGLSTQLLPTPELMPCRNPLLHLGDALLTVIVVVRALYCVAG